MDEVDCGYGTEVRSVFTLYGITFGLAMAEPATDKLKRDVKANDHGMPHWDDGIELFIDTTGKNTGSSVQSIVSANGAIQDIRDGDGSWNAVSAKAACLLEKDRWTIEVYVPYRTLGEDVRAGTGRVRGFQATRNRMAGPEKGGTRELRKLNAKSGGFNSNLSDFTELAFRE